MKGNPVVEMLDKALAVNSSSLGTAAARLAVLEAISFFILNPSFWEGQRSVRVVRENITRAMKATREQLQNEFSKDREKLIPDFETFTGERFSSTSRH